MNYAELSLSLQHRLDDSVFTSPLEVMELDKFENHYIFVYGTLKFGFENHILIDEDDKAEFMGIGATADADYSMYQFTHSKKNNYPVAFQGTSEKEVNGKIIGEVYSVSTKTIFRLDFLEQNGTLFERKKRTIIVSGKNLLRIAKVWMYLGEKNLWKEAKMNKTLTLTPPKNAVGQRKPFYTYEER